MFIPNVGNVIKDQEFGVIPDAIRNVCRQFVDSGEMRSTYSRRWEQYRLPNEKILEVIWHRHDGYGEQHGRVDVIIGVIGTNGEYE